MKIKKTKLKCDECSKDFEIDTASLKTKIIKDEIIKTYFECPFCGKAYTIRFDDDETFKIGLQTKRISEWLRINRGFAQSNRKLEPLYRKKQEEFRRLVEKDKAKQKDLSLTYGEEK